MNAFDPRKPLLMEDAVRTFSSVPEAARLVSCIAIQNVAHVLYDVERRLTVGLHYEACDEERASYEAYARSVRTVLDPDVLMDVLARSYRAHQTLDRLVLAGRGR